PAVEVMIGNARIADLIRDNKPDEINEAIAEGDLSQLQTISKALILPVLEEKFDSEVAANAGTNRHDVVIALDRALKQPAAESAGPAIPFSQAQNGGMAFAALRVIWQAAGSRYGIPWQVLGAINKVETNFGSNLGPSSAGAVGWMQFMPSTWARWGIDANG